MAHLGAPIEDSDTYPQGPYAYGGGEADSPQHCDGCQTFLWNPLTSDGYLYVMEACARDRSEGRHDSIACRVWQAAYL